MYAYHSLPALTTKVHYLELNEDESSHASRKVAEMIKTRSS